MRIKKPVNDPDAELLSVYLDLGVVRYKDIKEKRTNVTSLDLSKYQLVEPGEFVMNNQQAWRGSVGVSKIRGIVSPAYIVINLNSKLDAAFSHYLLRSSYLVNCYAVSSRGVGTIQRNVYWKLLRTCHVAFPPLPEQRAIAAYLDSVTAKIDALREKLKREIERLDCYKKSAITEAVCHGLNPKAKMKDSGIPWVGKVPEGWKIDKIKYMFHSTNTRGNKTLVLLAATQKFGMYPQDKLEGVVRVAEKTDLQTFKTVHVDDFVISLRSFQGGFERSDYEGVCSPAYQTFHATCDICSAHFKYLFKSEVFVSAINRLTVGIREGKNINYCDAAQMLIPIPPLAEQRQIAAHIDAMVARVDGMVAKRKQQLDALDKLKRTVVYDYVTGKKEVPR